MITFLQGFLIGAAATIGAFCIYLKLLEIHEDNIRRRRREAAHRRKIEAAKAERNRENQRQVESYCREERKGV